MQNIVVIGLALDIIGVLVLVVGSDKAFMLILKNLGRVVSSDWEEIIQRSKKRLRWVTVIYRRIKVRDHSSRKPGIGHLIRTRPVLQRKVH